MGANKGQFILLGLGILLGSAAIGLTSARRAVDRQEQEAAERAEAEAMDQESPLSPLPLPAPRPRPTGSPESEPETEPQPEEADSPSLERTEKIAGFQLRVLSNRKAALFSPSGDMAAEVDGFLGAREVPDARLFGGPVLEVTGKTCDDPCNPTVVLVIEREGRVLEVLRAPGVAKLDDLDRDGVPEVLLDHLMDGTNEVVTLPFKLDLKARDEPRYRAAYQAHPEGVDRQIEQLSAAAERLCTEDVEEDCQETLRGLLGLEVFRSGKNRSPIDRMRLEPRAKAWARSEVVVEAVEAEMQGLTL